MKTYSHDSREGHYVVITQVAGYVGCYQSYGEALKVAEKNVRDYPKTIYAYVAEITDHMQPVVSVQLVEPFAA